MTVLAWLVFLHVLGAAVWVGGQVALAPMARAVRAAAPGEPGRALLRAIARGAQPVLWAGLAVASASGLALLALEGRAWRDLVAPTLLGAKAALAATSAAGAAVHVLGARRGAPAWVVGGGAAVGLLAGLGLLLAGAVLRFA